MRLAAVAPALLLLATASCAPGPMIPGVQLDGWNAVEASEVRILGDLAPDEMQRLADELALFDATFAYLARWSPTAGAVPITVFVIRDRELAKRFGLGHGVAGWARITLDGGFSAVEARANHAEMRSTLFHEYTHVLLRRNRRAPLPPWYDEGLASFFSTLNGRDGAVLVGTPPSTRLTWVASRGPLSLADLFEGNIWGRSAQGVVDFYATSWALSHYLLLSPKGRREMSRLVEQLSRGVSPEEAQRVAFGRSPEQLESELRTHVAHLARGVPSEVVFDAEALAVRGAGRPAALSAADTACELGLLTLQRVGAGGDARKQALARRLLEMAAYDGPASARCQAALAEALALVGARDAEVELQQALARAPDDPRVQVHAGRAELARAEAAEAQTAADAREAAEGHFRRALTLDAGSASAWFGLGRCLQQATRPDEALVAFRKARRFGWSPSLDLALGELELERGRTQQAFDLLWPLVQDPHGGPTHDEAARLLEQAGLLPEAPNGKKP